MFFFLSCATLIFGDDFVSYLTQYRYNEAEKVPHTPEYDSSHVWITPTCVYDKAIPDRPSELFENVTKRVCDHPFTTDEACKVFKYAFTNTYDQASTWLPDGTVFVITGDLSMMWLRDSTAQVTQYVALADHPSIQQFLEGVLQRQMKWVAMDPYGSTFRLYLGQYGGYTRLTPEMLKAFHTVHVSQHDYEMDSLAYVIRLAFLYWKKQPSRRCWMDQLQKTLHTVVDLWIVEQDHALKSKYVYPGLSHDGQGSPVCRTGMTWGAYRPSDDPNKYHFNIAGNLMVSKVLEYVEEMAVTLFADHVLKAKALKLRNDIVEGVKKHGVIQHNGRSILAYEVDGCGNFLLGDEANLPSLQSLKYFGVNLADLPYENTRSFVLSEENPWYTKGSALSGVSSPHFENTQSEDKGKQVVWHLGLITEGLTATTMEEKKQVLDWCTKTAWNGRMHEWVAADGTNKFRRPWFGWSNSLFAEWLMRESQPAAPQPMTEVRVDKIPKNVEEIPSIARNHAAVVLEQHDPSMPYGRLTFLPILIAFVGLLGLMMRQCSRKRKYLKLRISVADDV